MSELLWLLGLCAVAEAGLEIGRAAHLDPEIRGRGAISKKIFSALQASVWSKNKGPCSGPATDVLCQVKKDCKIPL